MKFGCTVRAEGEDNWGNHASVLRGRTTGDVETVLERSRERERSFLWHSLFSCLGDR
jgi:hypothetical protein